MPAPQGRSAEPATATRSAGHAVNPGKTPAHSEGNKATEAPEPASWQSIKAILIKLQADLGKDKATDDRILSTAIEQVDHLEKPERHSHKGTIEARLDRIENLLKPSSGNGQPITTLNSWAAIAAQGVRNAGAVEALQPTRHTIRVQLANAEGQNNESILKEVKKTIPSAAGVRVLRSGDIDVTVPDEAAKDRAQGLPSTEGLKIMRKDYLVEIPSVGLQVRVNTGKNADNSLLAQTICDSSRSLTPGLQITRIRWLHSSNEHERRVNAGKERGSLIVGFPTQDMQRRAIQGGLVVQAQVYEVRQFERAAQVVQCFKCQQWGHSQNACGKQVKCGQCAGAHQSRECTTDRVSCSNCGKKHRTWEKRECPTFQVYHQGVERKRIALLAQSARIRAAGPSLGIPLDNLSWTQISRKRPNLTPAADEPRRRIGRPTNAEQASRQASRQASQARLGFTSGLFAEEQAGRGLSLPSACPPLEVGPAPIKV